MLLRVAPAASALAAVLLDALGAGGAALVLLLLAVPVASGAGLEVVAEVVDHERSPALAVPVAVSLLLLVAAAGTRTPELALGCVVTLGAEWVVETADRAARKRDAPAAKASPRPHLGPGR